MVTDDFTFPKVANPITHLTATPSLWRICSRVFPDYHCQEDATIHASSSFSQVEQVEIKMSSSDIDFKSQGEAEDKMDTLWEDFNDQFQCEMQPDFGCFEYPESNEQIIGQTTQASMGTESSKKKRKIVAAVKVIKKLFLLHNMSRIKKIKLV